MSLSHLAVALDAPLVREGGVLHDLPSASASATAQASQRNLQFLVELRQAGAASCMLAEACLTCAASACRACVTEDSMDLSLKLRALVLAGASVLVLSAPAANWGSAGGSWNLTLDGLGAPGTLGGEGLSGSLAAVGADEALSAGLLGTPAACCLAWIRAWRICLPLLTLGLCSVTSRMKPPLGV